METRGNNSPPLPYSYSPLPAGDAASAEVSGAGRAQRRPLCAALLLTAAAVLLAVAALAGVRLAGRPMDGLSVGLAEVDAVARSRGPDSGVSEKTSGVRSDGRLGASGGDAGNAFPWSNAMLQWQRTGFHFQPEKNWMNDPNGG